MSRQSHTRISRPLIVVLGATIVVGTGTYLFTHKTRPSDRQRLSLEAVEPVSSDGKGKVHDGGSPNGSLPPVPPAVVTQTPAGNPAPSAAPKSDDAKAAAAPVAVPASVTISPHVMDDAKAKADAGELVAARQLLNDALMAGHLSGADADAARRSLAEINQTVIFSTKRFKDDTFQTIYQVQSGDRLARIADKHQVTWELLCRVNGLSDPKKLRAGQWIKIPNGPFHCVVSKSLYRLDVYLGSAGESGGLFVTSFPVGLGKDNSTPTGSWIVQQGAKAHPATYYSPRGEGVIAADDPKNPLGGYWMGLTGVAGNALAKNSYGIHGTIDPDSIGKQASMGCIRLGHEDIALLYDLLIDGKSKVVVKD